MKVTLEKLYYDANGCSLPNSVGSIGSRREEVTKRRQQLQNAKADNLQYIGEEILAGGPGK